MLILYAMDNQSKDVVDVILNPKPKHPGGRPTDYKREYCQTIIDYFDQPYSQKKIIKYTTKSGTIREEEVDAPNNLPTLEGFAQSLGVVRDTIYEWAKVHQEFSDSVMRAKEIQKQFLVQNGLKGLYDPRFGMFVAVNMTDMRSKESIEITAQVVDSRSPEERELLLNFARAYAESERMKRLE